MSLKYILLIFKARLWIMMLAFLTTLLLAGLICFVLPKKYEPLTTLLVNSSDPNPVTGEASSTDRNYVKTQETVIASDRISREVVRRLSLDTDQYWLSQFLQHGGQGDVRTWIGDALETDLTIADTMGTNIISLSYKSPDAKFATVVVNTFREVYIDTVLALRVDPSQRTAKWFDQQVTELRAQVVAAQKRLTTAQNAKGIVQVSGQQDVETEKLNSIAIELSNAKAAMATAKISDAQNSAGTGNAAEQELRAEIGKTDAKIAATGVQLGKNHPDYLALLSDKRSLEARLGQEKAQNLFANSRRVGASADQVRQLEAAFEAQKAKVMVTKGNQDNLSVLVNEVTQKQAQLQSVMQRAGQLHMEGQLSNTSISTISEATVPTDATYPKIPLIMAAATALGISLAFGLGFLAEMVDRRVRSPEDFEASINAPVLAVLPRSSDKYSVRDKIFNLFSFRKLSKSGAS